MPHVTSLSALKDMLSPTDRMPLVFLGHGSPMNAIEDNEHSRGWRKLGETLPQPKAILVVSAHWMTRGTTLVDVSDMPRTIHDFGAFPDELFAQQYPAKGDPALAREVTSLLASHHAEEDDRWGLDHGAWSVLMHLYPDANVPVFQVSIDMAKGLDYQLEIGKTLSALRDRGVLILGSGNVVHNLRRIRFNEPSKVFDFTREFDTRFAERLEDRDVKSLADPQYWGKLLYEAHPTVDHYMPALTIAGAADSKDQLSFMSDTLELGSLSMRSYVFHSQ